jgi:hypothetical protein
MIDTATASPAANRERCESEGEAELNRPHRPRRAGTSHTNERKGQDHLVRAALDIALESRAKLLEVRSHRPIPVLVGAGFAQQQPLLVSEAPLSNENDNFRSLSTKHRRNVRNATKRHVEISTAKSIHEMRAFFQTMSRHYHDLGIPFFSRKFLIKSGINLLREISLLSTSQDELLSSMADISCFEVVKRI